MRQLPAESALSRALNGGELPWNRLEHLTADVWALWAKQDHPVRAEMEAQARSAAKLARVIELKTVFNKRKRRYGIGVT